jgi:hypothetical protein
MSHAVEVNLKIRSVAAAKAACKRLGWTFLENKTTYKWYGCYMGNAPLPEGVTADMLGKCEHAISVPGTSMGYQIGLRRHEDGTLRLQMDYYDRGLLLAVGLTDEDLTPIGLLREGVVGCPAFLQAYVLEEAIEEARTLGYDVMEDLLADGTVEIKATMGGL